MAQRQPDGRLSIEKVREMIEIALDQGSHRFEWLVRRYDEPTATRHRDDGIPFGGGTLISIVYRDVSAQKRAEAKSANSTRRWRNESPSAPTSSCGRTTN